MNITEFFFETIHGVDLNLEPNYGIDYYKINEAVRKVTGFSVRNLYNKSRVESINIARQVAMYFYWRSGMATVTVGKVFNRDHATVHHAIKKIRNSYRMKGFERLTEVMQDISELTGIAV